MASGPKKSARAPLVIAPAAFAPVPAPVVFEPEPAATVFDPGPAPVDLAPTPFEAALEPIDFEPAAVAFEPAPLVEKVEAVAAPIVEAVSAVEAKATAAMPALHEMQEKARSMVEKSLVETRAHYAKAKSAADEATSAIEASLGAAKTGAVDIHAKALATIKAQAEANFEFVKSVVAVKSLSDYVTLHTEFARKQLEAMTAHSKELGVLAQKVANDTAGPIKAHVAKTFKIAV